MSSDASMRDTYKRALWLGLPVLGLLELGLGALTERSAPRPAAYEALAPAVAALRAPGDLVVVTPRWAAPGVRRALGDEVFPLSGAAYNDADRYARALEISLGGESPELGGWRAVETRRVGPFSLTVRENPSHRPVLFDFVERLEPRWASAWGTASDARCRFSDRAKPASGGLGGVPAFPARRFECDEGFYLNVSATVIADQDFRPRRCVYAHPPAEGARVVRYEGVPLGDAIEGHLGLYWMIERARRGAPITLAIRVGDEEIGRVVHEDGEGWKPFRFPTPGRVGERADVRFEISTPDNTDRHLCFEAVSR